MIKVSSFKGSTLGTVREIDGQFSKKSLCISRPMSRGSLKLLNPWLAVVCKYTLPTLFSFSQIFMLDAIISDSIIIYMMEPNVIDHENFGDQKGV